MQTRHLLLGLLLLNTQPISLNAQPPDGQIVRGHNFEGVICTPEMLILSNTGITFSPMGQKITWTPSLDLILKAEHALPVAVAKLTKPKKEQLNYPKFYTAKSGTNLNMGDEPPELVPDEECDHDFLYYVAHHLDGYKRQYIGLTITGKRVLLMSFIYNEAIESDPPYLPYWKHEWIVVLDGGDGFWRVIYDPATGNFSDWQCNGDA